MASSRGARSGPRGDRQGPASGREVTEEIAAHLISGGVSPIAAINALRKVAQISLPEAKTCVYHSFSLEAQDSGLVLRELAAEHRAGEAFGGHVYPLSLSADRAPCPPKACPVSLGKFRYPVTVVDKLETLLDRQIVQNAWAQNPGITGPLCSD
jgi:hypothetical protein